MESIATVTLESPRMPRHGIRWRIAALAAASIVHAAGVGAVLIVASHARAGSALSAEAQRVRSSAPVDITSIVFLAPPPAASFESGGGGGGGNRQEGPIRHASGIGTDAITLRTRKPSSLAAAPEAVTADALPSVVLDARPLASGTFDQVGLPVGGVSFGTSTGPGTGGGVGEGAGTGIGPGKGPGIGPGEGGGIGGGVYRPGGGVTAPRVLSQVQPSYTSDALLRHIEGRVVLELIVRHDGCASDIRVVRSLDPGLDEQAILAVRKWQFVPGHLAGAPVDVVANVILDFSIR